MTSQSVACFAAALACYARIEGMRAANAADAAQGKPARWSEGSFMYEAIQLDQLSIEARNA